MDLRRLERWVTTALYIAGGAALVIVLAKRLLPDGWILQRLAAVIAEFLTELGGIGEGLLIVIILLILGGNRAMVSIFEGVDRYREWKRKNAQMKAEAKEAVLAEGHAAGRAEGIAEGHAAGRAEGIAEGHAAGRAEERAVVRARLAGLGLNPDDILPLEEPKSKA